MPRSYDNKRIQQRAMMAYVLRGWMALKGSRPETCFILEHGHTHTHKYYLRTCTYKNHYNNRTHTEMWFLLLLCGETLSDTCLVIRLYLKKIQTKYQTKQQDISLFS